MSAQHDDAPWLAQADQGGRSLLCHVIRLVGRRDPWQAPAACRVLGGRGACGWNLLTITIMIARAFSPSNRAAHTLRVARQQVRFNSNLPIPPKIATPKSVQGENAANTEAVVSFYKALPKGSEPAARESGIKGKLFDGKNASGKPIVWTIGFLILFGYTLEYNGHLSTCTSPNTTEYHKNAHH